MNKIRSNKIKLINIILIVFLLDQISKYLISKYINYLLNKSFLFFSIELVYNNGAAFNLFSGNRLFLSSISIISIIVLVYIIFAKNNLEIPNKLGLSFILAGSIGNGIDRVLRGYVVDFINLNFINFPVFNIADISINIGFFILLILYLREIK
tara:strand:+ start:5545 stop:6003 length:459 start_codon:yes stop_codon:yes gene_type:complete